MSAGGLELRPSGRCGQVPPPPQISPPAETHSAQSYHMAILNIPEHYVFKRQFENTVLTLQAPRKRLQNSCLLAQQRRDLKCQTSRKHHGSDTCQRVGSNGPEPPTQVPSGLLNRTSTSSETSFSLLYQLKEMIQEARSVVSSSLTEPTIGSTM